MKRKVFMLLVMCSVLFIFGCKTEENKNKQGRALKGGSVSDLPSPPITPTGPIDFSKRIITKKE